MKVCVKRLHCPHCLRLVRCVEQKGNGVVNVTCPRCKNLLYTWNGVAWHGGPPPSY